MWDTLASLGLSILVVSCLLLAVGVVLVLWQFVDDIHAIRVALEKRKEGDS
jgi:hypothetical protein